MSDKNLNRNVPGEAGYDPSYPVTDPGHPHAGQVITGWEQVSGNAEEGGTSRPIWETPGKRIASSEEIGETATDPYRMSSRRLAEKLNTGLDQGMNAFKVGAAKEDSFGSDANMNSAIMNKYKHIAGEDIQAQKAQTEANAPVTQTQYIQNAYQAAMAQQQVQTQNYEMMAQAYSDSMAARSQVMNNVFNTGGKLAATGKANGWFSGGANKAPSSGFNESVGENYSQPANFGGHNAQPSEF